ncbi:hypothetical protein Hypma_009655 [Hypsizygus marmoreus]|uniref:Glutamyl-tRNA(Gln) amidotransferase subunit F, mitochondrial n=1 Tax=Hypsizygus marmoreus TaxID=39966 RepID=A0A369JRJ9_HYPMA|nr:hypothetical protein Hypma_009655 [Hypsizygus marmoreus]
MSVTQRCLQRLRRSNILDTASPRRLFSSVKHETDDCGIPLRPTWSVNQLLSSYPKPTLSSTTLIRLHELSALIPPAEGTPEHAKLKGEMEEFIRLVEAVKLVDTEGVRPTSHRGNEDMRTSDQSLLSPSYQEVSGRDLLKHAERTRDGFYVVDSDRKR